MTKQKERESCGKQGHKLEEVKAVVGYQCINCDYYIRLDCIPRTSLGMRKCPRCKAEGDKLVDCNFYGSEYVRYNCHNCGHVWIELR